MTIKQLCSKLKPDTYINIIDEGSAKASSVLNCIYLYDANRSIVKIEIKNNMFYITVK